MSKHATSVGVGLIMVVAGLVLFFVFHDVETPVIGLRQLGVVLGVLGVVEVGVSGYAIARRRA
jgi:uncharacterized protein DUF5708